MVSAEKNEVGQKIRTLRKRAGLTQMELSERIGAKQSELSRMENGKYQVSLTALVKILGVLDLTMGEFFGETAPLAATESALLDAFRKLDEDSRQALLQKALKLNARQAANG